MFTVLMIVDHGIFQQQRAEMNDRSCVLIYIIFPFFIVSFLFRLHSWSAIIRILFFVFNIGL